MSTYSKITKHPQSGIYEVAEYRDDFFGPHIYGVYFESDDKTYPEDLVDEKQVQNFDKDDVLNAFRVWLSVNEFQGIDSTELSLLNEIQRQYKLRWEGKSASVLSMHKDDIDT